jgi:hypothetical protein
MACLISRRIPVTLQSLKMLSIVLVVALSSCAFSMGPKAPKDVKIYEFHPGTKWCRSEWCQGKTGFVRAQAKVVIPATNAEGFIAMTPEDFGRIIESCPRGQ